MSFLPYLWRFNQNMRKWLVYNHKLQKWNALKYFTLILGPLALVLYCETHSKFFYYNYYIWKSISSLFKVFWDFYFDWGLFRGTKSSNRLLRDNMKFSPQFYYLAMIFDVFGLFFWAVVVIAYEKIIEDKQEMAVESLEFYNNVNWIIWAEMIVVALRRTIWVLIRVENEFFSNFEQFRDITTIPPIKKEE